MEGRTIIRKVKVEDNLPLAKMIREVFEEHNAPKNGTVYSDPTTNNLYKLFQIPDAILFVAETDNVIEGCCGIYPTEGLEEGYAELVKFYLSKNARGKGIGKALMAFIMNYPDLQGLRRFTLGTKDAHSLYEKFGFTAPKFPERQMEISRPGIYEQQSGD